MRLILQIFLLGTGWLLAASAAAQTAPTPPYRALRGMYQATLSAEALRPHLQHTPDTAAVVAIANKYLGADLHIFQFEALVEVLSPAEAARRQATRFFTVTYLETFPYETVVHYQYCYPELYAQSAQAVVGAARFVLEDGRWVLRDHDLRTTYMEQPPTRYLSTVETD